MRSNIQTRAAQIKVILSVANDRAEKQQRQFNRTRVLNMIGGRTKSFVVAISAAAKPHFELIGEVWLCFPKHAPGLVLIHDPKSIIPRY